MLCALVLRDDNAEWQPRPTRAEIRQKFDELLERLRAEDLALRAVRETPS